MIHSLIDFVASPSFQVPSVGPSTWMHTLLKNAWFASIPGGLQQALLALARPMVVQAGQFVFRKGDRANCVYVALDGDLRFLSISGTGADRRETVMQVVSGSDWFGEAAMFDDTVRSHHVQATGDSCVLRLDKSELDELSLSQPSLLRHFGRLIVYKARATMNAMEVLRTQPVHTRLASRLLGVATSYGLRTQPATRGAASGETGVSVCIMQTELASLLGCTRQTVNRMLAGMQNCGWLQIRRSEIVILDLEALRRHAHGQSGLVFL